MYIHICIFYDPFICWKCNFPQQLFVTCPSAGLLGSGAYVTLSKSINSYTNLSLISTTRYECLLGASSIPSTGPFSATYKNSCQISTIIKETAISCFKIRRYHSKGSPYF